MSNAISRLRDALYDALSGPGTNTSRVPAEAIRPPHIVIGEISLQPADIAEWWDATVIVYVFASSADARNIEQVEEFMAPDTDMSVVAAVDTVASAYVEDIEEAQVFPFAGVDYFGSRITVRALIS